MDQQRLNNKPLCKKCETPFRQYEINDKGEKVNIDIMAVEDYVEIYGDVCFDCLNKKEMQKLKAFNKIRLNHKEIRDKVKMFMS